MIQIGNSQFIIFQLKQYAFQEMIYYKLWSRAEIVLPEPENTRKLPSTAQFQAFPLDLRVLGRVKNFSL